MDISHFVFLDILANVGGRTVIGEVREDTSGDQSGNKGMRTKMGGPEGGARGN